MYCNSHVTAGECNGVKIQYDTSAHRFLNVKLLQDDDIDMLQNCNDYVKYKIYPMLLEWNGF